MLPRSSWCTSYVIGRGRRRPDFLAEGRTYFVQTMRARARRFRLVLWIGVLLLAQLILVLLDQR
jgi:hypothetical protein